LGDCQDGDLRVDFDCTLAFPAGQYVKASLEIRSFSWATFPLVRPISYRDDYRTACRDDYRTA
jgi:hypothetical protein